MEERLTVNHDAAGSSPAGPANLKRMKEVACMSRKTKMNHITSPELIDKINPDNIQLKNDFLDYLREGFAQRRRVHPLCRTCGYAARFR